MKKLVLTIAMGEYYRQMAEVAHPSIRNYAGKLGADFKVITEQKISKTTPHWEKFQIFDFLNTYDRILFLDTDLIVRADTPDLFALVPESNIGAFNEASYSGRDSGAVMSQIAQAYGQDLVNWDGRYFNTGVMVVSRVHQPLFVKPVQEIESFYEQSYLNLVFARAHTPMTELDWRFNRTVAMDQIIAAPRLSAYIIHYAACVAPTPQIMFDYIKADIASWQSRELT